MGLCARKGHLAWQNMRIRREANEGREGRGRKRREREAERNREERERVRKK